MDTSLADGSGIIRPPTESGQTTAAELRGGNDLHDSPMLFRFAAEIVDESASGIRQAMSEYRLYCLNDQGNFTKSHEIEAADDGQALVKAREMKLPVQCELWARERLVAKLPAHS